jgi:hypothetical protein
MTNLCLEKQESFGVGQRYSMCEARLPGGDWFSGGGNVVCMKKYFKRNMEKY